MTKNRLVHEKNKENLAIFQKNIEENTRKSEEYGKKWIEIAKKKSSNVTKNLVKTDKNWIQFELLCKNE